MGKQKRYFNAYFCFYCDKLLTEMERLYSKGRCPYCGRKHPSACTIVETRERAAFILYPENYAWYRPWTWYKAKIIVDGTGNLGRD